MFQLKTEEDPYTRVALLGSAFGHSVLLYLMLVGLRSGIGDIPEQVVYSVTMEGSNTLGGVQQVPKEDKKSEKAPPKNVRQEVPQEKEKAKTPTEKDTKQVVEEQKVDDAEVSLKEKATPEPTPKVKPTPQPTPKAESKPQPKATPKTAPVTQKQAAKTPNATQNLNKNFEAALQRYLGESTNAGGQGFGGDGRGGTGMGGGVVKPPEWFLYKDQLEIAIKRGWNWHDNSKPLTASVSFKMTQAGALSDVRLVRSSGNAYYDESVIRAVNKASPVPAPPPQFYNDFKFVELDFTPE